MLEIKNTDSRNRFNGLPLYVLKQSWHVSLTLLGVIRLNVWSACCGTIHATVFSSGFAAFGPHAAEYTLIIPLQTGLL